MRRAAALGSGAIAIAVMLTGCVGSDLEVRYSGPFALQVSACVVLGASASLREDVGVPSGIWVDNVNATQSSSDSSFQYTIEASTHVTDASGERRYDWVCELNVTGIDGVLDARLLSFDAQ